MVEQLSDVQRAPQRRLRVDQAGLNRAGDALSRLSSELEGLSSKAGALKKAQLYDTRGVSSTDSHVATASVRSNAYSGSHVFNFTRLATAAAQRGGSNAGQGIDLNADVTTSAAGFATPISAGRFTVNGEQIEVQAGDSLNDIMARVASQAGIDASYDSATDKISLSDAGGNPIVLGSAADTSNFLRAARLSNNGTNALASSHALGGIDTGAAVSSARFNTAVTSGSFEINGVSFTTDAAADTVADVLNRINQSAAGVAASYDSVNDRFSLTNKITGDIGFSLVEGTSNFLSAARLTEASGGNLARGQDAEFTVNNGDLLTSHTNSLGEESHGIAGLVIDAKGTGIATIQITNDSAPLKQAITDFVDQYNKVQSLISVQAASSTDAKGVVTAGLLASDATVAETARKLRSLMASDTSTPASTLKRLQSLGFKTGGYSNEITLEDSAALDRALTNSMPDVKALFTQSGGGIATKVAGYLDNLVGFDGSFLRHRDSLANQANRIDAHVQEMEKSVLASRDALLGNFRAMEKTLAQINRQSAFFTQRFGLT